MLSITQLHKKINVTACNDGHSGKLKAGFTLITGGPEFKDQCA